MPEPHKPPPNTDRTNDTHTDSSHGVTPGRVTRALLAFYLMGLLLNGVHLHEEAQRMEYGKKRDALVAIARPIAYISELTRLHTVRTGIEHLLNPDT